MTDLTKQAIEALRRLLDVSMVAMTDKDLATEETVAAWDAASEALAAYEAAQQAGEQALPPYGFCPICGSKGHMRERQPNGNDTCEAGHKYPSNTALKTARAAQAAQGASKPPVQGQS